MMNLLKLINTIYISLLINKNNQVLQTNLKTFIVCLYEDKALNVAKDIIKTNDELSIIPRFTTNTEYKNEVNENYVYYLDVNTVNLSYKNNALLYIKTDKYISSGITIDDFYNNDICYLTVEEFNSIPEVIFRKYDILVIWVDTKNHKTISNADLIEINYFSTFITSINYLYFLENETNIHTVILDYIFGDEEKRKYLLEENN